MELNVYTDITEKNSEVACSVYSNTDLISCCILTREKSVWTISKWSTYHTYQHCGYGKLTMKELLRYCIKKYGTPSSISYIWNGKNSYVGEWIKKNFDAKCCCPISVLKNNSDDDWESHIYRLNVSKVLEYFGIN